MHLRCTYDAPKMHLSRRSVVVLVAPRLYPHPYPQHECSCRLLHPPPLSSPLTAVLTRGPQSTSARRRAAVVFSTPPPLSSPAALRARVLVVVPSSSPPPASSPQRCPHPRPSERECSSSCRRLLHPPPLSSPAPLGARVLVAVVYPTPPPLSSPLPSPAALGARVLVVVPSSSRRLWGNTWGNVALE